MERLIPDGYLGAKQLSGAADLLDAQELCDDFKGAVLGLICDRDGGVTSSGIRDFAGLIRSVQVRKDLSYDQVRRHAIGMIRRMDFGEHIRLSEVKITSSEVFGTQKARMSGLFGSDSNIDELWQEWVQLRLDTDLRWIARPYRAIANESQ